jgi:UDP-glucose 4-epimerase
MSPAKVLVPGGAGYVGSHVVKRLRAAGHDVVVLDNLSTGFAWAVGGADLVVGDVGDPAILGPLFKRHRFDAVLHFAAHIWVGESLRDPVKYYRNNVASALTLFDAVAANHVPHLVFSSTAAVYGEPALERLDESLPSAPTTPYGASKMIAERLLTDIAEAAGLSFAILRYFNVAGADPEAEIGEATPDNQHLIKIACETALGLRGGMRLHGTDYPTPDGTCVRDYVHVKDLASAHLDALAYLRGGGPSTVCNCGYGRGRSNRQVIEMVKEVSGVDFTVEEGPRRAGDPPRLIAGNDRIKALFGWQPRHDDLRQIVETAWRWDNIWQRKKLEMTDHALSRSA